MLEVRTPLFKRYLDCDQKRELQALYALQVLMHRLEHPNSEFRDKNETKKSRFDVSD